MAEPGSLNRLSCTRCKERKVRCNRVMPQCARCTAQNVNCFYPERVKRKSTRPVADHGQGATNENALNTILQRLERLEEQKAVPSVSSQGHPGVHVPSASPISVNPSPSYFSAPSVAASYVSPREPSYSSITTPPSAEIDATAILKEGIDLVEKIKLRGYATSVINDKVDIPPNLAKTWIANYFIHVPTDMFLSLINKRLIEMMPDIMQLPHVHVDAAIIVLYHCILYHGCTLNASNMAGDRGITYAKTVYIGCLRAIPGWQREATGSTMDLVAALFVTRVAAECFDFDLGWKMHKLTCDYAEGLNLHNLDAEGPSGCFNSTRSDDDRKGFWQLIQIDLFLRLLINKPPIISAKQWKVNLPWLNADSQPPPDNVQAMAFLVCSRITLVVIHFFALLDNPDPIIKQEIRPRTEALCHEITQLLADWQLNEWVADVARKEEDAWVVIDCVLTGHTCIIFMLRKLDIGLESDWQEPIVKDSDIPDSPLVLEASRQILRLLIHIIDYYPNSETICTVMGVYTSYVSVGYLYHRIFHASDLQPYRDDMKCLEQLSERMTTVMQTSRDVYPMVRSMQSLTAEMHRRMN